MLEDDVGKPTQRPEFGGRPTEERKSVGDGVDALRRILGSRLLVLDELGIRNVEEDLPLGGFEEPNEATPDSALSRAALADEADNLLVMYLQTDVVDRLQRFRCRKATAHREELVDP